MVTLQEVERQLKKIQANYRFWGRPEILELPKILIHGEQINACINGRYGGGFATFCATDQRLLLIDKKLLYLTVEDVRYDMVNEVDYTSQLLSATLSVCTSTKTMTFSTLHPARLRQMSTYIQQRIMQLRQGPSVRGQSTLSSTVSPRLSDRPHSTATQPVPASPITQTELSAPQAEQPLIEDSTFLPPVPRRRNPYVTVPLMIRQRIGRFGVVGAQQRSF